MEVTFQAQTNAFGAWVDSVISAVDAGRGPIGDSLRQSGAVYLSFIRRRFLVQSRGGGEWPDLALATKLARARRSSGLHRAKAKLGEARDLKESFAARHQIELARKNLRMASLRRQLGKSRTLSAEMSVRTKMARLIGEKRARKTTSLELPKFPILQDTRLLFNSLVVGSPQGLLAVYSVSVGLTLRVGTSVFYAAFHQSGTARMPQRRIFVDPDQATGLRINQLVMAGIMKLLSGAG